MRTILQTLFDIKAKMDSHSKMLQDMKCDMHMVKRRIDRGPARRIQTEDGEQPQGFHVQVPLLTMPQLRELEEAIKEDENVDKVVSEKNGDTYNIEIL